jgi:hypothetical protein
MVAATKFIPKKDEARVEGDQEGRPQHGLKARHDKDDQGPKLVTQHIVVDTQNDPRIFWRWDQNPKKGFIVSFPLHQRTPCFDVV